MLGVLLLIGLTRLLDRTRNVWLCAGVYTVFSFLLDLSRDLSLPERCFSTVVNFGLSYLFFFLLRFFEDSPALWWTTLVVFLFFPIVLAMIGS